MERRGDRPTNLDRFPLAGVHRWRVTPDDHGQLVRIDIEEGESYATVLDGEDEGEVLKVREMGGEFERT